MQLAARNIRLAQDGRRCRPARCRPAAAQGSRRPRRSMPRWPSRRCRTPGNGCQKSKSLIDSFTGGIEELAKAQKNSLAEIEKRDAISGEWYQGVPDGAQLVRVRAHRQPRRSRRPVLSGRCQGQCAAGAGLALRRHRRHQAGSTRSRHSPRRSLHRCSSRRGTRPTTRNCRNWSMASAPSSSGSSTSPTNSVKTEALKADIIANRTVKAVEEAGALMETQVSMSQKNCQRPRGRRWPP